jgi:hypothetical protein
MQYRKLTGYKYQTTKHTSCMIPTDLFQSAMLSGGSVTSGGGYITLATTNMALNIKQGYCWDGPSGPTIDTDNFMRGSLFHDALYQIFREYGFYRQFRDDADQLLRRMCIEDGMSSWRARWVYWGVKTFGRRAAGG